MTEKESCLKELKKEYSKLKTKYNLPSFDDLNREFSIEKISDVETDFLLREIRKMVSERLYNFMRNVETLINPSNASMFVFSMVKNLDMDERKLLQEMYKELAKSELELIKIDVKYSEKDEAEFIKKSFALWGDLSGKFLKIIEKIESNWENKKEGKSKGYFG